MNYKQKSIIIFFIFSMTLSMTNINCQTVEEWILEGNDMNRYHIVERWCGYEIKNIGKYLINLTDIEINPEEIY